MFLGLSSLSHPVRGGRALLAGATFIAGALVGTALVSYTARSGQPPDAPVAVARLQSDPGAGHQLEMRSAHPAQVLRVIDGDTFEARVRVWPGLDITTKVRLRGIDAPEFNARCAAEIAKAEAARNALVAILAEGDVGIARVAPDKYGGRVVADASTRKTSDVSAALLDGGLVRRYAGGRRESWC